MTQFLDEFKHPRPGGSTPDPRAFLEHFEPHRRAGLANWFHYACRGGASSPPAVCSAVWQTVQQRLQWSSALHNRQFLQGVLEVLSSDQAGALAYANAVIQYEKLPREARQQVKAERAFQYLKGHMVGKAPTEKQLSYLSALHYKGEPPADRAAASTLIDQLRHNKGGGQ